MLEETQYILVLYSETPNSQYFPLANVQILCNDSTVLKDELWFKTIWPWSVFFHFNTGSNSVHRTHRMTAWATQSGKKRSEVSTPHWEGSYWKTKCGYRRFEKGGKKPKCSKWKFQLTCICRSNVAPCHIWVTGCNIDLTIHSVLTHLSWSQSIIFYLYSAKSYEVQTSQYYRENPTVPTMSSTCSATVEKKNTP